MLGAMVGLNTLGDMQVRFQVGSEHPSDWIQDRSAWSHPSDWIQDPRTWSHGQTEHYG